jgi:hypothetical protein
MTDLERFEQWARERGHYQAYEAVERFRAFLEHRREQETDALIERQEGD